MYDEIINNNLFTVLPNEIIDLIKEYIPKKNLVFTNRENYFSYHSLIKSSIKNYEKYVRDIIRRDNEFVFHLVLKENLFKWINIKKYYYKNMIFNNYLYFISYYSIENESNKCRTILNELCEEQGLCKNLHKKNVIKYIKWKN
jgi:c-di-AMP phosphodiesterase-like protein